MILFKNRCNQKALGSVLFNIGIAMNLHISFSAKSLLHLITSRMCVPLFGSSFESLSFEVNLKEK